MRIKVSYVRNEVFLDAVLAVGTTDTALLHTGMEALHGLEVLAVDISFAEFEVACYLGSRVDILREYR